MSNPFDQFAADFQAALPPGAPGASPPASDPSNPFGDLSAQPQGDTSGGGNPAPAPSDKPVMNSPPPQMGMNPMNGGYGGPAMGGPAVPPAYGGMPPNGYGLDGPANGLAANNAPPPMQQQQPPPPYQGQMGMPPAQSGMPNAASDSFGQQQQQPPQPNMSYGASPSMPTTAPPAAPSTPAQQAPSADPFGGFGAPAPAPPSYGQAPASQGMPGQNPGQSPAAPAPSTDPFASFGGGSTPAPAGYQPEPTSAAPSQPGGMPSYGPGPSPAQPPQADPFGGSNYAAPAPANQGQFMPQNPPGQPQPPPQAQYGMPPSGPPNQPPGQPDPFGGPGAGQNYGQPGPPYGQSPAALPPSQPTAGGYADPWNAPQPPSQPPADPNMGALVPSQQTNQPYAQIPPQYQQQMPPQQGMPPAPPQQPATDPFSVFEGRGQTAIVPAQQQHQQQQPHQPPPPPQQAQPAPPTQQSDDDFFASMGFDSATASQSAPAESNEASDKPPREEHGGKKDDDLPPGGEWYDARIFTPTLGVMFFKPQELTDSLFLNTDSSIVDGLAERPVVAFIVEGSSARSAGVELGHVLLKVNGVDVKNPKEASRLIKEGPRPLPLLFYVPNTEVVIAEGEHMVKYDTRETTAPNSAKDWKPKYVVIGGIIAQPWMMNMYRSKSEYDIAVIETQARRPVSVKVKQFSLQGARIQNDWQGPQMVKYKNKLHPWKYIVVLPVARNPIKISSPNLSQLKPVHEGIRRVLLAQQRDRGGGASARGRESYGRGGQQGYDQGDQYTGQQQASRDYGNPSPQYHQQQPPQAYGQQQAAYHGGAGY